MDVSSEMTIKASRGMRTTQRDVNPKVYARKIVSWTAPLQAALTRSMDTGFGVRDFDEQPCSPERTSASSGMD
jgi:hypothetical protein